MIMIQLSKVLSFVYLLVVAGIMVYAAAGHYSVGWVVGALFMLAITALPQLIMIGFVQAAQTQAITRYYIVLQLLLSALALYGYVDGFFIHIDAQSGILFIFIPIYQTIIAYIAYFLQKIFAKINGS